MLLPGAPTFDDRDAEEMKQIVAALESHRAKYGEYPPDFSTDDPAREIREHLANAFPLRDHEVDLPGNLDSLNPSNALYFWLRGMCTSNPQFPVTGGRNHLKPPMTIEEAVEEIESLDSIKLMRDKGVNVEKTNEYQELFRSYEIMIASQMIEHDFKMYRNSLFPFVARKLNRNREYSAWSNSRPLVYFRSDSFTDPPTDTIGNEDIAFPYQSPESSRERVRYMAATTFQIVNAGQDGVYGSSSIRTSDAYLDDAHCDNITSFSFLPLGRTQLAKQRKTAVRQCMVTPLMAIFCTLLYPVAVALRRPEEGVSVLSRSLRAQWSNTKPSAAWKRILDRQRNRKRISAIDRMKVAHLSAPRHNENPNPNRQPRTLSRSRNTQDSPPRK